MRSLSRGGEMSDKLVRELKQANIDRLARAEKAQGIRAGERRARAQVIAETLRWAAGSLVFTEDQVWLEQTADEVDRLRANKQDWTKLPVCPLCSEVQCDHGCPLRPLRENAPDAGHILVSPGGDPWPVAPEEICPVCQGDTSVPCGFCGDG